VVAQFRVWQSLASSPPARIACELLRFRATDEDGPELLRGAQRPRAAVYEASSSPGMALSATAAVLREQITSPWNSGGLLRSFAQLSQHVRASPTTSSAGYAAPEAFPRASPVRQQVPAMRSGVQNAVHDRGERSGDARSVVDQNQAEQMGVGDLESGPLPHCDHLRPARRVR
jgi:hypothetical protein